MLKRYVCSVAIFFFTAATVWPATGDRWLHVKVEKSGGEAENVRINVPLAFVEKVLPLIQADEFQRGKIQLADKELDRVDLRGILDAVSTLPDSEFVTVQKGRDTVRVAKANGYLLVKTDQETGKPQKVNAKIPISVVQALLSGSKNELNILAAIKALGDYGDSELVTVDDNDTRVRIWVDGQSSAR